jgi:hypothetical protein
MTVTYNQYDSATQTWTRHEGAFAGATLGVWSECIRIMSDVWAHEQIALVWNGTSFQTIHLDNSEFSDPAKRQFAKVDASPELIEQYRANQTARIYSDLCEERLERRNLEAKAITPGSVVVVKRGRKDLGKVGKVVFIKDMPYSAGYRTSYLPKACIALDGQKTTVKGKYGKTFDRYTNVIWVWSKNVDLATVPEQASLTAEDKAGLLRAAQERAEARLISEGVIARPPARPSNAVLFGMKDSAFR